MMRRSIISFLVAVVVVVLLAVPSLASRTLPSTDYSQINTMMNTAPGENSANTMVVSTEDAIQKPVARVEIQPGSSINARRVISPVIESGINTTGGVSSNQRFVTVSGHITCVAGEPVQLKVTVTQLSTGTSAQGHTPIDCTGSQQEWTVRATVQGGAMQGGSAQACGLLKNRGDFIREWCRDDVILTAQ